VVLRHDAATTPPMSSTRANGGWRRSITSG
jgi:hypothetical protein